MLGYAQRLRENFAADRAAPPLLQLAAIESPEPFLRAILPYVSRTFSLFVSLHPPRLQLPLGAGYAFCRALDFFEDVAGLGPAERRDGLVMVADFVSGGRPAAFETAAALASRAAPADAEDRASALLVGRLDRVRGAAQRLAPAQSAALFDLVAAMAEGMQWNVRTFAAQAGKIETRDQTERYCVHVAGVVGEYIDRLIFLDRGLAPDLSTQRRQLNHRLGRLLQLTNIARDLEEDLANGRIYDYRLFQALAAGERAGPELLARVRGEIHGEIDSLFAELPPFLAAHRHRAVSRARGALLFPFALADLLRRRPGTAELRRAYLYSGKRMVRRALRLSLSAMLCPALGRRERWSRAPF